jgi:hypothetical protein
MSTSWHLAFTIRSDSLPELQSHRRFQDLKLHPYDLRDGGQQAAQRAVPIRNLFECRLPSPRGAVRHRSIRDQHAHLNAIEQIPTNGASKLSRLPRRRARAWEGPESQNGPIHLHVR